MMRAKSDSRPCHVKAVEGWKLVDRLASDLACNMLRTVLKLISASGERAGTNLRLPCLGLPLLEDSRGTPNDSRCTVGDTRCTVGDSRSTVRHSRWFFL